VWVHEEVPIDLRSKPLKKKKLKKKKKILLKLVGKKRKQDQREVKKGVCGAEEGFYSVFFHRAEREFPYFFLSMHLILIPFQAFLQLTFKIE
jgi:hypothetical protein